MNELNMSAEHSSYRVRLLLWSLTVLVAGLFTLLSPELGYAQNTPDAPAAVPAPTGFKDVTAYPPLPKPFSRGNFTPQGGSKTGPYLNFFILAFLTAIFLLWSWSTSWAYKDGKALKLNTDQWCSIMLVAGFVTLLLAFQLPNALLACLVAVLGYAVPIGVYVKERNDVVPESAKVLTPKHIRNLSIRFLARMGIRVGSTKAMESAIGPPISFIGKSASGPDRGADRNRQVETSRGYLSAKELIYDAILRRATDVHLEPKEDEVSVRLRIDGMMYPTEPYDKGTGEAIINIFKVLSAMDITERRRPQDGSFRAEMDLREIDFRVATQGTRFGEKMVMRILDQGNSVTSLAQLGMRKQVQERLAKVISQPHGLFLASGPTGAGKSTTLYSALHEIDAMQTNIITVEDPIEYKMANVTQIEINKKSGQSFATALRSILRQDPDVVMIGEIRDNETAGIACQAANTGHMVFSTVHANDTFSALFRMLELGVETYVVADSVSAIVGQRLARRLCPDCKLPYKPNPESLKAANISTTKIENFFKPPTDRELDCTTCGNLGYKGRVGVYEFLEVNDRIRDLVREKAPMNTMKAEARKNGMLSMKEEGLRLVVSGLTSIDELLRVVK